MATEIAGDDPPVYVAVDDGRFRPFCNSLSQFLVTFCLHESVFSAPSLSSVENLSETTRSDNKIRIPLWGNGGYPSASEQSRSLSFYIVDGCVLQMDPWCGGKHPMMFEKYPYFFPNNASHRPDTTRSRHLWEIPEAPKVIKTQRRNVNSWS
jgi:hypothetical protein